ncbi:putative Protein NLRC3 [Paratrimastix pyriformis]|uniref:Uncharacterized protein n=1 Tax=Paratrimastix pyriformis TaxID=342808 RepID=A0ABQ8U8F4_9EUKA|nr:putative Protein NLRC3 [Paratrimastix pyriformis]
MFIASIFSDFLRSAPISVTNVHAAGPPQPACQPLGCIPTVIPLHPPHPPNAPAMAVRTEVRPTEPLEPSEHQQLLDETMQFIDQLADTKPEALFRTFAEVRLICKMIEELAIIKPTKDATLAAEDEARFARRDPEGIAALALARQSAAFGSELNLSSKGLTDVAALMLAEWLQTNQSVTKLHLGFNQIGDEGASGFAFALTLNTTLRELYLANNQIGDKGAGALAAGLAQNRTLRMLTLAANRIGDEGTGVLAAALPHNGSLQTLTLVANRIGDEGACVLAAALQNSSLKTLDLCANQIGDKGACALAAALALNTNLQKLSLDRNPIGDEGTRALTAPLPQNHTLRVLELPSRFDMNAAPIGCLSPPTHAHPCGDPRSTFPTPTPSLSAPKLDGGQTTHAAGHAHPPGAPSSQSPWRPRYRDVSQQIGDFARMQQAREIFANIKHGPRPVNSGPPTQAITPPSPGPKEPDRVDSDGDSGLLSARYERDTLGDGKNSSPHTRLRSLDHFRMRGDDPWCYDASFETEESRNSKTKSLRSFNSLRRCNYLGFLLTRVHLRQMMCQIRCGHDQGISTWSSAKNERKSQKVSPHFTSGDNLTNISPLQQLSRRGDPKAEHAQPTKAASPVEGEFPSRGSTGGCRPSNIGPSGCERMANTATTTRMVAFRGPTASLLSSQILVVSKRTRFRWHPVTPRDDQSSKTTTTIISLATAKSSCHAIDTVPTTFNFPLRAAPVVIGESPVTRSLWAPPIRPAEGIPMRHSLAFFRGRCCGVGASDPAAPPQPVPRPPFVTCAQAPMPPMMQPQSQFSVLMPATVPTPPPLVPLWDLHGLGLDTDEDPMFHHPMVDQAQGSSFVTVTCPLNAGYFDRPEDGVPHRQEEAAGTVFDVDDHEWPPTQQHGDFQ